MLNIQTGFRWLQVSVLGVAALLSGCVTTQENAVSPYHDYSNVNYLHSELSDKLKNTRPGQSFMVYQSPWGENATILILEHYFAASGRNCAKFSINGSMQIVTACEHNLSQWVLNPDILISSAQG